MHESIAASAGPSVIATAVASRRYRAFISYSHSDAKTAAWLHRSLEGYRVPSRLRGTRGEHGVLPERLSPIFRDREDLASAGELGARIESALFESDALIVICSPDAARSPWVENEILTFKRLRRGQRIYCLIVAGEPHSGGESECFSRALRFELGADGQLSDRGAEPLAADLREGKDGKALARLKLLSGLLGVDLDTLRQREAQRRQRRLLLITAAALLLTLAMAYLAVQAVIAQRAAERRQKQAEALVNFMLGDLNDKLAQVQRLDILEAVDDKAMEYFQSLPTEDVTDEALEQRVKALEKIGNVRWDQGQIEKATDAHTAALRLAEALVAKSPRDIARQKAQARLLGYLGEAHWQKGELDAAYTRYSETRRLLDRARATAPDDTGLLFELAMVHNNLGQVLERSGEIPSAQQQYEAMRPILQRLTRQDPGNGEWQGLLGDAENNLGKLALLRGDLLSAIAAYAADYRIKANLAARDSRNNESRENLLRVQAILGRTLALAGEHDSAIALLQSAVSMAEQLVAQDASVASTRNRLALYASQLARLQRLRGDREAAARQIDRALPLFAALNASDPTNTKWQREYAEARIERAEQLSLRSDRAAALFEVRSALAALAPMLQRHADDAALLLAANGARLALAAQSDDATDAARLRADVLRSLEASPVAKDDLRLQALRVEALLKTGRRSEAVAQLQWLRKRGYRDPYLLALLQQSGIDYPPDAAFEQQLAAALPSLNIP
jgi:tetratricopeptide (TPR) repeat protein